MFGDGCGRFEGQQGNGLLDAGIAKVDPSHEFRDRQTVRGRFQCPDNFGNLSTSRKGTLDEVVVYIGFFLATKQNAIGGIQGASGTAHLLVIGNHRTGCLVMDHKSQVGLVVTHSQCRGGN